MYSDTENLMAFDWKTAQKLKDTNSKLHSTTQPTEEENDHPIQTTVAIKAKDKHLNNGRLIGWRKWRCPVRQRCFSFSLIKNKTNL